MSAILPSLDLVVNRLTTITVVDYSSSLAKTTIGAIVPAETIVKTTSNVGIHRINTTPILSNTVAVAYPTSSLGGAQFAVVDTLATTTSANANSFAVTGTTTVFGGGLNYTYGSTVANVAGYSTVTYTTPGTYTWTCPTGVTSISMAGVGGGGGGQQQATGGSGGGGGWIDYTNNYTVVPGTQYTVVVGTGGSPGTSAGNNGGATYFVDSAAPTPVIYAAGGIGGAGVNFVTGGLGSSIFNSNYTTIDTFTAQNQIGSTFTYSISSGPTGLAIGSASGVLSYTQQKSPSSSGTYTVTVTATANTGGSASKTYTLIFDNNFYLYYLLVAGGGGAGAGGSVSATTPGTGGAGGVILGNISTTIGSGYVTVGGAGAIGANGGNTSVLGAVVFGSNGLVAIGGGAGGSAVTGSAGSAGGSGGGGGYTTSLVSGIGGAALQPTSTWGGYGNPGTAGNAGGLGGGAGNSSTITSAAGSLSFNGSSYLTAGATTDWTFMNSGLQDYTMECWFYTNTLATGYQELFSSASFTVDRGVEVAINGTLAGQVAIIYTRGQSGSNTGSYTVGGLFTASTWNHMAATFVASTKILTIFVNGVEAALTTGYSKDLSAFPFSASAPTSPLTIGRYAANGTSGGFFNGYITNLRITKSILYTGTFTPTVPLYNIANTQFLLSVASDANKTVDSSSNAFTLTNVGVTYNGSIVPTALSTNGAVSINILGNVVANYSDGGTAANSSVNYGGGGGRSGYGAAGNAGVAYFWYAGGSRSPNGDLIQSISYGGTNYWLHKFVSSQFFNIYQFGLNPPTLVDYIIVGGGGGGGYTQISSGAAGGGGAGGIVTTAQYSTQYTSAYQTATNANFAMGTADFTAECWVWIDPACDALAGFIGSVSGGAQGFGIARDYGCGILNANGSGGTAGVGWLSALPTSTWMHIAMTMQSDVVRLYKDGVFQGSATRTTYSNLSTTIVIGNRYTTGGWSFTGYITNVRVISGTALYTTTGTFTVPTAPLTAITNTIFLTAKDPTSLDFGSNQNTVTTTGTVAYSATQTPFASTATFAVTMGTSYTVAVGAGGAGGTTGNGSSGSNSILGTIGGSLSFSGSNSITVPYSASAFLLTGDFTVECWVYPTSFVGPNGHGKMIFSNGGQSGGDTDGYSLIAYSGSLNLVTRSGSGNYTNISIGPAPLNAWSHVAYTRYNGNHNLWLNGVFYSYSGNQITGPIGNSGYPFSIGDESVNFRYNDPFTGYITGVRVINGSAAYTTALYPSGFTPGFLLNVTNTKLLLNVGTSATYLTDSSSSPLTPVNNGGVTFSTLAPPTNLGGVSATGGGGGGYAANASPYAYAGLLGGSGGGGAGGTAAGAGAAATAGQGRSGATGSSTSSAYGGGGGGGAGAAGVAGTGSTGGAGGAGTITPLITTTQANTAVIGQVVTGNVYFGGGGGGGVYASTAYGAGGVGGGGAGGSAIVSGAVSFAGAGQYLKIASTYDAAWSFPGDFTIEAWVYWPGTVPTDTGQYAIISDMETAENRQWELQYYNNYWRLCSYGSSTNSPAISPWGINGNNTTGKIVGNTWYHIAATRSGTTGKIWVNGVDVTASDNIGSSDLTSANNATSGHSALYIGQSGLTATWKWTGYITNVRITKGQALYNTAFTPAAPLSAGANTTVLLLFNTDLTKLVDSSTNAFPVTNNGSVTWSNSTLPAGTGALIANGAAGTINTGGGGGGAGAKSGSGGAGGAGGAGVIIIRYPDVYSVAASTTGSPTLETANGYRTYIFKTSGSITF